MGNCTSKVTQRRIQIDIKKKIVENAGSEIAIQSVYKFFKTIGTGSFGVVKKAMNINCSNEYVAIKTLFKDKVGTSAKRLKYEIDILITLDHPNIIKCYETFEETDLIHIVMEYLRGGELMEILPNSGSLDEPTVLLYARSMLMAVNYIHQIGIVHRDLKPENFLFGQSKSPEDLKLVDFGLSNKFSNKFQKLHSTVGTPYYIAPEVLKGNYDSKCDMWSIGVILFLMLSGEIPFYAENVNEVFKKIELGAYHMKRSSWSGINEETRHLVTRLLCLNVHDRLSASEALMHPAIFSIPRNLSGNFEILEKIKLYSEKSFLQQCLLTALCRYIQPSKLIPERKIFSAFDRNLKGSIGPIEICDTLEDVGILHSQHEISELMSKVGIRSKTKMYFSEFIGCLINIKEIANEELFKLGFEFFDRSRKGYIDKEAFRSSVQILGKVLDFEEIEKIFKNISKTGTISFSEFKLLFINNTF